MSAKGTHFEKTVLLTLGQLAGLGISFLIPIFLSRWLTVESYGTYKQLMLIHTLLLLTVHMGIDWGIFYFIKRNPDKAPLISLNAMLVDFCLCAVVVVLGILGRVPLADALQNPELAHYLPAFGPFVLFYLPTHHFTHFLVVMDKIKPAMWLTIVYETLKTIVIVSAYYFFNSLTLVLLGLGLLSLARFVLHLRYNLSLCRELGLVVKSRVTLLREQIRFALPLGFSNLVSLLLRLDRFIVSSLYGVRAFTLYSVGCFEIPLAENTVITMADLMSFDMVEAHQKNDYARLKELWLNTLRKIALFHLPLTLFMVFFAREVITFIYSNTYAESAQYFALFSVVFLIPAFVPEVVFRVFAANKKLLRLRIWAAVYTLSAVIGGAVWWGPIGALYGKLIADLLSAAIQLNALAGLMRLSFRDWLPWQDMGVIAGVSAVIAAGVHLGRINLVGSFVLYGALVFIALSLLKILRPYELAYLKARVTGLMLQRSR